MSDSKYIDSEFKEVLAFTIFAVLIFYGVGSIFFATIFRGFDDPNFRSSFNFYSGMVIFSGLAILGLAVWNKVKGKRVFILPIHEPEESVLNKWFGLNPKFLKNPYLSLIFFFLIFTLPIYRMVVLQFNLTFLPIKTQAIAPLGSVWANVILPMAENMVMFILVVILFWVARRFLYFKSKFAYYLFTLLIIPLILAGLWVLFHALTYSASGVAQVSTFIAGFFWIWLVCFFMSMIGGFVFHALINFFLVAFELGWLATYWITVSLGVFYIILIVLFIWIYRLDKNKVSS